MKEIEKHGVSSLCSYIIKTPKKDPIIDLNLAKLVETGLVFRDLKKKQEEEIENYKKKNLFKKIFSKKSKSKKNSEIENVEIVDAKIEPFGFRISQFLYTQSDGLICNYKSDEPRNLKFEQIYKTVFNENFVFPNNFVGSFDLNFK